MAAWTTLQKVAATTIGAAGGVAVFLYSNRKDTHTVLNSWTTNTFVPPEAKWDFNWDHREPASLVKPIKNKKPTETEENDFNEKLVAVKPTAVRHLFLIRHGQYNLEGKNDSERYLTELGRKQAAFTGDRLKTMNLPWDKIVRSTMTRAQETGKIISGKLPAVPLENCSLIEEGAPIAPEPPIGHWRPEPSQFFQDGARIEAGFRKHFHRADVLQKEDSYTLIVCHANVIRYFVCRALQFPPQAWLRLSLNHASITWVSIQPSGRVNVRTLGDSGHIPIEYISYRS